MLTALAFAAVLASTAPEAQTDAPKPDAAVKTKTPKPGEVCTSRKVGRLFGHDVIRTICRDAKPGEAPAAAPSTPG